MSIWELICYWVGLRSDLGPRYYKFSESTLVTLKALSEQAGSPEHELTQNLVAAGLSQYYSTDELMWKWEALSARERYVAALICLAGFQSEDLQLHNRCEPPCLG